MAFFVLVHSPLVGVLSWAHVANVLWEREIGVVVPGLHHDPKVWRAGKPYWQQHVEQICASIAELPTEGPDAVDPAEEVVLVGHSAAGVLLPAIGDALDRPVAAYIFCDADLPIDGKSRFDLFDSEEEAEGFRRAAVDEMLPPFPEEVLRAAVPDAGVRAQFMEDLRSTPLEVYEEPIPLPATWPDAPVAYLGFGKSRKSYSASVKRVNEEKWVFSEIEGAHFHMLVDPDRVAKALLQLAQKCGVELG